MHRAEERAEHAAGASGNSLETSIFGGEPIYGVLTLDLRHGVADLAFLDEVIRIPLVIVIAVVGCPIGFSEAMARR